MKINNKCLMVFISAIFVTPTAIAQDAKKGEQQIANVKTKSVGVEVAANSYLDQVGKDIDCFSVYKQQDFANRFGLAAAYLLRPDVAKDVDVRWGVSLSDVPFERVSDVVSSMEAELASAKNMLEKAEEISSSIRLTKWSSSSPKVFAVSNMETSEGYLIPANVSIEESEKLLTAVKLVFNEPSNSRAYKQRNIGIAFASQKSIPDGITATQIVNWDAYSLNSPNTKCLEK